MDKNKVLSLVKIYRKVIIYNGLTNGSTIYNFIRNDKLFGRFSSGLKTKYLVIITFLMIKSLEDKNYEKFYDEIADNLFSFSAYLIFRDSVDEDCAACGSSGNVFCGECNGNGQQDCEDCDGDGEDSDGDTCSNCDGDGYFKCEYCGGSGEESCEYCDGDGFINNENKVTSTVYDYYSYDRELYNFLEMYEEYDVIDSDNFDEIISNKKTMPFLTYDEEFDKDLSEGEEGDTVLLNPPEIN